MNLSSAPMVETVDNPTRAFVAEAVASGHRDVSLDINPALTSLSSVLVESKDGELLIRFTAPHSATQGNGVVSGGAQASMLDLAMAMSVLAQLKPGTTCATISLSVNMQAAAQQGHLFAVARVDRIGRQVAFARAELYDSERKRVLANATSSLALFRERR
jgi:uncharacterized protein (TIGR00369 family)